MSIHSDQPADDVNPNPNLGHLSMNGDQSHEDNPNLPLMNGEQLDYPNPNLGRPPNRRRRNLDPNQIVTVKDPFHPDIVLQISRAQAQNLHKKFKPICPLCNSAESTRFRYFNNEARIDCTQPRYTCDAPTCGKDFQLHKATLGRSQNAGKVTSGHRSLAVKEKKQVNKLHEKPGVTLQPEEKPVNEHKHLMTYDYAQFEEYQRGQSGNTNMQLRLYPAIANIASNSSALPFASSSMSLQASSCIGASQSPVPSLAPHPAPCQQKYGCLANSESTILSILPGAMLPQLPCSIPHDSTGGLEIEEPHAVSSNTSKAVSSITNHNDMIEQPLQGAHVRTSSQPAGEHLTQVPPMCHPRKSKKEKPIKQTSQSQLNSNINIQHNHILVPQNMDGECVTDATKSQISTQASNSFCMQELATQLNSVSLEQEINRLEMLAPMDCPRQGVQPVVNHMLAQPQPLSNQIASKQTLTMHINESTPCQNATVQDEDIIRKAPQPQPVTNNPHQENELDIFCYDYSMYVFVLAMAVGAGMVMATSNNTLLKADHQRAKYHTHKFYNHFPIEDTNSQQLLPPYYIDKSMRVVKTSTFIREDRDDKACEPTESSHHLNCMTEEQHQSFDMPCEWRHDALKQLDALCGCDKANTMTHMYSCNKNIIGGKFHEVAHSHPNLQHNSSLEASNSVKDQEFR